MHINLTKFDPNYNLKIVIFILINHFTKVNSISQNSDNKISKKVFWLGKREALTCDNSHLIIVGFLHLLSLYFSFGSYSGLVGSYSIDSHKVFMWE